MNIYDNKPFLTTYLFDGIFLLELSKRPHLLDPSATSGVEASLGSVVNGLDGMGLNLKAFFTQLQVVLQEFSGSFFEGRILFHPHEFIQILFFSLFFLLEHGCWELLTIRPTGQQPLTVGHWAGADLQNTC